MHVTIITTEVHKIRKNLQLLLTFDWVSVPIVYTQVRQGLVGVKSWLPATVLDNGWLRGDGDYWN